MDEIAVTFAADQGARACLALLPEVKGAEVELLIARRGGAIAGAAAIQWQSWATPAGFPITVHVIPDQRRRGVGRALIRAAAESVAEETDGLWSFDAVSDSDDAALFLAACGFARLGRQHYFQCRTATLLDNIRPLTDRLRRRSGEARSVVIKPVAEAPLEAVGWLIASQLAGGPQAAMARIQQQIAAGPEARDRSMAALIDGEVAGVILWRIEAEGLAAVEARVVAPRWRGGPVNLLLLEAGLLRGEREGLVHTRFHCEETVKDTLSLARRARAEEIATRSNWYFPIDAG